VTTVLEAGGRRRTMADSGLVCGRSAVDATAAGTSAITATVDDQRPTPLMTDAKGDRRAALVACVADDRCCPLLATGVADDWHFLLLLTGAGNLSATSSDACLNVLCVFYMCCHEA